LTSVNPFALTNGVPEARVGQRLTAARRQAGLSRRRAARLAGVDRGNLVRFEKAKARPPDGTLIALCRAYGVTVNWLIPERSVNLLSAYWVLGEIDGLRRIFEEADLEIRGIETRTGTARFGSIDEVVKIEVESTPLIERIDKHVYAAILADAQDALAEFRTEDGRAELPIVGHIVTARR